MSLADRLSEALRAFFDAPRRPSPPPRVGPAPRPEASLFVRDAERAAARREDAMSLMDDDCLSYVIVQARGTIEGPVEISARCGVDDFAWPAMSHTLARLVMEADRVHGR